MRFDFERLNKAVTIPSLTKADLLEIEIDLPSVDVQADIVEKLDSIDRLISLRKQQLAKLDELIKARFVEMFGDPETNPKGWEKAFLKDHATVFVGYPFESEGYTSKGIKIIGGYNLMQGFIQWDSSKYWPDTNGFEQYLLKENDIVMAMDRPWVNGGFKIALIDSEHLPALLIQRTACIRRKDIEHDFLFAMLDSDRFARHCNITGSLVPHISNKDINSFQIIIPPLKEQQGFTTLVKQVNKSKSVVQQSLDKLETLKNALMQEFFG